MHESNPLTDTQSVTFALPKPVSVAIAQRIALALSHAFSDTDPAALVSAYYNAANPDSITVTFTFSQPDTESDA